MRPVNGGQIARMERPGWWQPDRRVCGLAAEELEMSGHGMQSFLLSGFERQNPVAACVSPVCGLIFPDTTCHSETNPLDSPL